MLSFYRFLIVFWIVIFAVNSHARAFSVEQFYVLVNAENDVVLDDENAHVLLRRIYLKQLTAWPSGKKSYFFARKDETDTEGAFRKIILKMSDAQLNDHWLKMKQIRGSTPPRAVGSTRILLRQLEIRSGAVGVVSAEDFNKHAKDNPKIKILTTFVVLQND